MSIKTEDYRLVELELYINNNLHEKDMTFIHEDCYGKISRDLVDSMYAKVIIIIIIGRTISMLAQVKGVSIYT